MCLIHHQGGGIEALDKVLDAGGYVSVPVYCKQLQRFFATLPAETTLGYMGVVLVGL